MKSWKQSGLAAAVVIIAILTGVVLQSWSLDHGPAAPAATPGTATTTVPPTPGANASTGIPDLDRLIAILTSGDVAAVKAILIETPSPCVVTGIYNPPACPAGVAAGTMLPVFRASAGEAVWPGDLERVLDSSVTRNRTLYGVRISLPIPGQQWVPAGNYAIVVGDESQVSCSLYFATREGIVGAIFVPCSSLAVVFARYPSRGDILPLRGTIPTIPTTSTTPAPTATPIGIDWAHRLAVYTTQAREERTGDRSIPVRAVITWDVTAGKLAAAFEYSGDGEIPLGLGLAGRQVVFATESRVVETALDGTGRRELFITSPGDSVQDIAISPDGRLVAVVVSPNDIGRQGVLRIFDLQTFQERLVVRQSDSRFAEMWGHFWQIQWRADGTGVLVGTATHSEMYGSLATIFLDGRARIEDVQGYGVVSPSGTLRAGDIGESSGCMFIGTHNLVIRNLDTGGTPASIGGQSNTSLLFTPWEWSPDGTQFVFLQQPTPADCEQLSSASGSLSVLTPVGGGAPQIVGDLAALHRAWYGGDNLFTADCEDGNGPVLGRTGKLLPLCYSQPGPGPYQAVTVRLGGQFIGTAVDPVPVGVIAP